MSLCQTVLVLRWLSHTLPPFPDLYFPVGQSRANPKSLPASPWRRASVEQMASVCRAAIKEGAWSGGKESGSGSGGEQGRQREAASALGLRTDTCMCALCNARTHTCVHASVNSFQSLRSKNKYPPHASNQASAVWEWKEGLGRQGIALETHTMNLFHSEKSE